MAPALKGDIAYKSSPKICTSGFSSPWKDICYTTTVSDGLGRQKREKWHIVFTDKNLVDKIVCPQDKSWKQGKLLDNSFC